MHALPDFVRKILDNPDDDAPRLVLADYLEEQGSSQGEFIRVQCELANPTTADRRRAKLAAREQVLRDSDEKAWLEPLTNLLQKLDPYPGLPLHYVQFRRGLVECIRVELQSFTANAEKIMAVSPIRDLMLVGLGNSRQSAALFAELGTMKCWSSVEFLGVRLSGWTSAFVSSFLRNISAPRLTRLYLFGDDIDDRVARALAIWPGLLRLTELHVFSPDPNACATFLRLRDNARIG